jgi:hypothetical protein
MTFSYDQIHLPPPLSNLVFTLSLYMELQGYKMWVQFIVH